MLATIAVILIIIWLVGLFAFKVTGFVIHLLLIAGIIALIAHFARGRRTV